MRADEGRKAGHWHVWHAIETAAIQARLAAGRVKYVPFVKGHDTNKIRTERQCSWAAEDAAPLVGIEKQDQCRNAVAWRSQEISNNLWQGFDG